MAAGDEPVLNPVTPPTPTTYRLAGIELVVIAPMLDQNGVPCGEDTFTFDRNDPLPAADRQTVIAAVKAILRAKGRIA